MGIHEIYSEKRRRKLYGAIHLKLVSWLVESIDAIATMIISRSLIFIIHNKFRGIAVYTEQNVAGIPREFLGDAITRGITSNFIATRGIMKPVSSCED